MDCRGVPPVPESTPVTKCALGTDAQQRTSSHETLWYQPATWWQPGAHYQRESPGSAGEVDLGT